MEKNKDMNEEELKAQQEETLDNVATSQQDEGCLLYTSDAADE